MSADFDIRCNYRICADPDALIDENIPTHMTLLNYREIDPIMTVISRPDHHILCDQDAICNFD